MPTYVANVTHASACVLQKILPCVSEHLPLPALRPGDPLQRDDLKGEAIQGGLVETLLQVARSHKAPRTICECATCLYQLMQDRESWPRVVAAGEWHGSAEQQGLPKGLCSNHGLSVWNLLWLRVLQAAGRLPLLPSRTRQS